MLPVVKIIKIIIFQFSSGMIHDGAIMLIKYVINKLFPHSSKDLVERLATLISIYSSSVLFVIRDLIWLASVLLNVYS